MTQRVSAQVGDFSQPLPQDWLLQQYRVEPSRLKVEPATSPMPAIPAEVGQTGNWEITKRDTHSQIIGGPANGGPLEKEMVGERFSLYAWTGGANDAPQVLIPDLRHYTTRPEGVDLIEVAGELRVVFVEDRYKGVGYARRNAVHWPITILGSIQ